MQGFTEGERVYVSAEVAESSCCEFVGDIAGKEAFVAGYYPEDNEVFVVSEVGREEGTYVPLELVSKVS